jgi:serine/threonine protein kinase
VSHAVTRASLCHEAVQILNRGSRRNPDVLLVPGPSGPVVVKDWAPRGPWVRRWLAPWLGRREERAYQALRGHPAVPRLLGRIDELALVIEYRPGRRMGRSLAGEVPPGFVDALASAVDGMHARGVAHLDLRHRSNVLADAAGRPVLIDFGSAVCLRPGGLAARLLLPPLAWIDRRALEKWRVRLEPPAQAAAGASGGGGGASRPT